MAAKEYHTSKNARKTLFSLKKTHNSSSSDPSEGTAPTDPTSTSDARGILNKKDGLHNFGVALELLKCVSEGNELLAPLKAVCGGLKVLVDTAEASDPLLAIQQNDEDLRDLNTRLQRQLDALEQQDKTLSASELNGVHKEIEYFVKSLRTYILDLNKVQKVLDILHQKEGGSARKFFKKALMVYSVREEIKDCSRQLDESFQLFMNSVTGFIAHQAVLLRNDIAEIRMRTDEKKANDALAQLPCSDARGNQHDSCLEGTREDILTKITKWATNAADKPMFCLVDLAGTGKSTISTHMTQKWEMEGALIGRFFFSLPNSVTNANELPTTLARDMANSGPSLRSLILDAINDHPNITGHSIKEKLEWFVFTPLKRRRDCLVKGLEEVRKLVQEKVYSQGPTSVHPEIAERQDIKGLELSYRRALEQARKMTGDGLCKESLEQTYMAYMQALETAYVEALERAPIVVIDALDECAIVDRGTLLKSILSFLDEASLVDSRPLKVFLTCRPDGDIVSHLQEPRYSTLIHQADLAIRLEKNASINDDINLYANKYLDQVLSSAEIDLFVIRANGLFIWASTARAFLADALDPSARFEELLATNTKSSPLDSLYDKVLRSAVDRVGCDQVRLLRNVLQGICIAREPLCTRAMDELLGLSNGVARRVVNMLRSVLSDGTGDKAVQALHPTFIEYFRAGSQPNDIFFFDGDAETLLAGGCLDVLSSPQLRFDICGVMGPDRFAPKNKDIKDLQQRLEETASPGLQYAAVHGLSHVARCLGDRTIMTKLREFLMSKLLYWIELMSLIGRVYHLMRSVHHLKSQIKDGMNTQSMDILKTSDKDWCEEIHRLVQPVQVVIENSALQVYFSALPFAPSTSQMSHFYHQRFADRIPKVLLGAWRVQSQHTVLSGHTNSVTCLLFSPDGRSLASGSRDDTVRLWDAITGAAIGDPPTGHTGPVGCLSFSPDGQRLASGSRDDTVRLWDVTTGAAIGGPLTGHAGPVSCLSFSPDGQRLASGSDDCTVQLWDATTGAAIGDPLTGDIPRLSCLSFSPDGQTLASGSWDGTICLWDTTTGVAIGEPLTGHISEVHYLSFSPDGRTLASRFWDGTVRLWDTTTGVAIGEPLSGHTGRVPCLSFSPDGRTFASGFTDDTVRLWNVTTGAAIGGPLTGHTGPINCLSFSPDSRSLASGSTDCTVRLWDATTGAAIGGPLTGHTGLVSCLSFSPDGQRLASGSDDCTVWLWDVTTGVNITDLLTGHTDMAVCLSFSPDGRTLASGSWDRTIRLWDATTGVAIGEPLSGHTGRVPCLSFSPDGRKIASGSDDHMVRLWDTTTGAAIGDPLTGHTDRVNCLSFSSDGRRLASGSWDDTVRLWDAITGAAIGDPLTGHTERVSCLSFSPDGRTLASGSWDSTVLLWDTTTGATIGKPVRHESHIRSLSFHIHDESLFLAINDGSAVWKVSEGTLIRLNSKQRLSELILPHSNSPTFKPPWTYVQSLTGFHFSLPSSFQCRKFASHGRKLAYGGTDGSVIIIDCSHLV